MMRFLYLGFRIYCFIFRPKTLGVRVMLIRQVMGIHDFRATQTYQPG